MKAENFFRGNLVEAKFAATRAEKRLDMFRLQTGVFKTGITNLDATTRLAPAELTVLGGRAGTGKTALAMQLVGEVIAQLSATYVPGVVAFFSAEMDGETLLLREACALEGISFWRIQQGEAPADDYERVKARLKRLDISRLYIDEHPAPTLDHMATQLDAIGRERVAMVVFDYTELSGEFGEKESERISIISRGLKGIAKECYCPVLTLSQLNRDIEGRAEKRPTTRDLMHGGEREPDRIMVLVRPWMYDKSAPPALVNCHVIKNRNGPLGEAPLFFEESTMRFKSAVKVEKKLEG